MQKLTLGIAVMFSVFVCFQSFCQQGPRRYDQERSPTNVVKINLLSPFALTASVFYERTVWDQKSLQLGFFYTGVSISDTEFRGFGITPEFRFYLSEATAPNGFYLAPYLRYQRFRLTVDHIDAYENVRGTYAAFGLGGTVGKQWVFNSNITLNLFIGPGFNFGSLSASQGNKNDFNLNLFSGFTVRGGVTLGYTF